MDSNRLKSAVIKINSIINSEDKNFITEESKSIIIELLNDLSTYYKKASTTAIALIQYLTDRHFDISKVEDKSYHCFIEIFGDKIAKLSTEEKIQLRKISEKLILN